MAHNAQSGKQVGRDTLLVTAFVCLAVGFTAGVVFKAYQVGSSTPHRGVGQPPGGAPAQDRHDIEELETRASLNPDDAHIWRHLGDAYSDAGQHEEAVGAYKKSLQREPENADVWTDLGVMYRRAGDPRKAVESFDRAFEIDPRHEISRFNKGVVLLHDLDDVEGAAKAWEQLLEINPDARAPGGEAVRDVLAEIKARAG